MNRFKELVGFVFLSLLTCLAVFQDAMWGRSIAAPLDIAPSLWQHYAHVDPNQGPIPKNHYTVDQLSYDLPLQFLMHQAWRSGEIPWWNPYSAGGRPLLADAHCNGTDPIRLLVYFTVPDFVLAYNWTLILHAVGTGVGAYFLLRRFGARPSVAGVCALAAQWAGGYVLYIGHPWVRASFIYYPFLWMAWERSFHARKPSLSAPWCVAAIFYAGNLQSHAYLPIFALSIAAGFAGRSVSAWVQAAKIIVPAGVLGILIAAPVLVPQLELYLHAVRPLGEAPRLYWLETGALLGAIHPWIAGTFRTISIQSINGGPSFHLAIGGVLVVLALFGWRRRRDADAHRGSLRAAGFLVLAFLIIAFTPLHPILYLRAAGLGILGLTVLAGWGAEVLLQSTQPEPRWGRAVWTIAAVLTLGTALLAHAVYPRFQAKAEAVLLARADSDGYGGATRELRKRQADSFASEVSPLNPECALNLAGLGVLGRALSCRLRRSGALFAAAALSLIPVLSFSERFITRCPLEMWVRLLEGGPAQKGIIAAFTGENARFVDKAAQPYQRLFPQDISGIHRLHVAHGYAALLPRAVLVRADSSAQPTGIEHAAQKRFAWADGKTGQISILGEKLNSLQLSWEPPAGSVLVRTDTSYPGWSVGGKPVPQPAPQRRGGEVAVPSQVSNALIQYYPSYWRLSLALEGAAMLFCAILALRARSGGRADQDR